MCRQSFLANKVVCLLLAASVCLCSLAGCVGGQETATDGDTVTFTDALDRTVTVAKKPARVAALLGSFADVWLLAGGSVCAAAEDAWDDFELKLDGAVNLGGAHSPSLEALLSANPDFVLASASTSSNVEMREVLENAGIRVAYFDVDCFDDYLAMLKLCTDITERPDLYEQNGVAVERQIEQIKAAVADAALAQNERSVLLLRASSGFVKAKGSKGTILGEMLSDLGLINIADSDRTLLETLSIERIIRENPYRIFVVTMGDDTQKAMDNLSRMMTENPAWGSLEAVKNDRLYVMERKLYNIKPNAKWAQSYEKLRNILLETDK